MKTLAVAVVALLALLLGGAFAAERQIVRPGDHLYWTPGADGVVLDLSTLPFGKAMTLTRQPASVGPVTLDFGPKANLRAASLTGSVTVTRTSQFVYTLSAALPVAPTPPVDNRLLVAGQSLADDWSTMDGAVEFAAARRQLGDVGSWGFLVAAKRGSALLEELHPSDATNYWIEIDTKTRGAALIQAESVLANLPEADKPTAILWDQGQTDGLVWNTGIYDAAEFQSRRLRATRLVLYLLRAKIRPEAPYSIPVYITQLGGRSFGYPAKPGDAVVRAANEQLVALYGAADNLHLIETPLDLPLRDSVHPTDGGYAIRSWIAAKEIP